MPVYQPLLQGFSDLSSALLVAPQMARQRRMEEEDRAYRRQAQESALAQALTINNQNLEQRQTERADRLAELQQRKTDSDLDRALRADENKSQQEYRSQQIKRSAEDSRRATAEEARRWVEMGGKALGSALGRKPGAAAQRPILNNLGSELQPDQRQWNPVTETWDKPRLGGELSAALGAPAPVNGAPAPTMTRPNGEVWTYNEGTGGYVPPGGMLSTEAVDPSFLLKAKEDEGSYDLNQSVDAQQRMQALSREAAGVTSGPRPEVLDFGAKQVETLRISNPALAQQWARTLNDAKAGNPAAIEALRIMYSQNPEVMKTRSRRETTTNVLGSIGF